MKKLTKEKLMILQPNVVENDLVYISSVLSHVDSVVSKTYGPRAGFVAQAVRTKDIGGYTYTKDGMTTLNKMQFNIQSDTDILNIVRILAYEIKAKSGDGSTTGAKVLSGIINKACEDLLNNDYSNHRINTPKAVELLQEMIKDEIKRSAKYIENYEDILDVAYISLNNDERLLDPFKIIVEDMKNRNVSLADENRSDLLIQCFNSYNEKTTVTVNPGYRLGAHSFVARGSESNLEMCKVIMLSNTITMDYIHFILKALIRDAKIYGNATNLPLLFIVAGLDRESKDLIRDEIKKAREENTEFYCDFLELDYIYDSTNNRREDLSYFLNIDTINLTEFIEKRESFKDENGNDIWYGPDSRDTTNLLKWKATRNENGEINWNEGAERYQDVYLAQLEKGLFCNVKYVEGLGLTISPSGSTSTSDLFNDHIKRLKEQAKDPTPEIANVAKERLYYLKSDLYAINVGRRIADGDRLYHAFNDAARAVSSSLKDGYHMGASVGAIEVLENVEIELNKLDNNKIIDTAKYILNLLKSSFIDIVPELLYDCDYETALKENIINKYENKVYDTVVINPIMTDLTIMSTVLYQFASLYASLILELDDINDAEHVRFITKNILLSLEDKVYEKKEVIKDIEIKEIEDDTIATTNTSKNADSDKETTIIDTELDNTKSTNTEQVLKESEPVKEEVVVLKENIVITPTEDIVQKPKELTPYEIEKLKLEQEIADMEKDNKIVGDAIIDEYGFPVEYFDEKGAPVHLKKGNSKELIEKIKNPEMVTQKYNSSGGASIEIHVPKNILPEDLERIKSGDIFGE